MYPMALSMQTDGKLSCKLTVSTYSVLQFILKVHKLIQILVSQKLISLHPQYWPQESEKRHNWQKTSVREHEGAIYSVSC